MAVAARKPELWAQQWDVGSHSKSGVTYVVSLKRDGTYACACPAWKFAKAPKPDCGHIREVQSDIANFAPQVMAAVPAVARQFAGISPSLPLGAAASHGAATRTGGLFVAATRRAVSLEGEI